MIKRLNNFLRSRIWRLLNLHRYARLEKRAFIECPFILTGQKSISLGEGVKIWPFARIEVFTGSKLAPALIIGEYTTIQPFVHIGVADKVTIGKHCLIASNVYISDHDHNTSLPRSDPLYKNDYLQTAPVTIGPNVWIGEKANILKGVSIGESSIIGAGSTVTKDIPSYCIAAGSPAKIIKVWDADLKKWVAWEGNPSEK